MRREILLLLITAVPSTCLWWHRLPKRQRPFFAKFLQISPVTFAVSRCVGLECHAGRGEPWPRSRVAMYFVLRRRGQVVAVSVGGSSRDRVTGEKKFAVKCEL